ncbi:MAG: 4Fe-4S binding protein [Desulfarculaceae bacterium]|nr:4Fe-4S binding protein [Desulfarculaceae bacterium]MCF8071107.1 4Fe-4S binding protein [Desulfarculaceae bacterium]MCF8101290.1 4Fe-4S binding protein [Desulfarculaceae bacterium]MCF8115161.1 4Fe-4S binding protein [Desulfarculaceae bacterium]
MKSTQVEPPKEKLSIYRTWCKRCGNCVAFCPRGALAADQWGHPYLKHPERCTSCGLCAMLCPDFALSVTMEGDAEADAMLPVKRSDAAQPAKVSFERLAPSAGGEG